MKGWQELRLNCLVHAQILMALHKLNFLSSVKVIVCVNNMHEKFSLNLLLCITVIHHPLSYYQQATEMDRTTMADRSTIAPLHSYCCLGSPGQQGFQMLVLSSQHCLSSIILKPSSAAYTFVDKLTAMWPDMSSKRGIGLFLARRDLAAIRPCVTPDACVFVPKCMKFSVVDRFMVLNKTARKVYIIRCILFPF